ncbi:Elongation of very long chain fatty acids protein 7 [Halotydeus destructor]|nr:Elongation of very long chain fatty acids protein 7 [Halotydeus destructor]
MKLLPANLMDLPSFALFDFWERNGDPRVRDLPLLSGGPIPVLTIIGSYLLFVYYLGPKFMENRKPIEMRPLMLFFNSFMLAVNGAGFVMAVIASNGTQEMWACRRLDPTTTDFRPTLLLYLGYFYLWSRIFDMIDTVFFTLRKKYNHVSFLHVFHHGIVPLIAYMGLKLHPGGNAGYLPLTNVFIHTIMYTYYGMSCMGPAMAKHVWWKKHLTQIQLLQFVSVFLHAMYSLLTPGCSFPLVLGIAEAVISGTFFVLFTKFYFDTYKKDAFKLKAN